MLLNVLPLRVEISRSLTFRNIFMQVLGFLWAEHYAVFCFTLIKVIITCTVLRTGM